jgi:hypothetical protein
MKTAVITKYYIRTNGISPMFTLCKQIHSNESSEFEFRTYSCRNI